MSREKGKRKGKPEGKPRQWLERFVEAVETLHKTDRRDQKKAKGRKNQTRHKTDLEKLRAKVLELRAKAAKATATAEAAKAKAKVKAAKTATAEEKAATAEEKAAKAEAAKAEAAKAEAAKAWVTPDPALLFHIPPDLTEWFTQSVRRYLSGDEKSLPRALGLIPPPGRPFDPATSPNLELAVAAFWLHHMCGLSWKDTVNRLNEDRAELIDESEDQAELKLIDESVIRGMVKSHEPAIYQFIADVVTGKRPPLPVMIKRE
jgi:hypothetical protein